MPSCGYNKLLFSKFFLGCKKFLSCHLGLLFASIKAISNQRDRSNYQDTTNIYTHNFLLFNYFYRVRTHRQWVFVDIFSGKGFFSTVQISSQVSTTCWGLTPIAGYGVSYPVPCDRRKTPTSR